MKTCTNRIVALMLAMLMLVSFCFASCNEPEPTPDPTLWDDYFPEKKDGYNQVTFFWNGDINGSDMWIWWGDAAGRGYLFHECGYGGKVVVDIPEGVDQVGFIVRTGCTDPGGTSWGTANKDGTQDDRFATITGPNTVIYLKAGNAQQYFSNDGGKTLEIIQKFVMAGMESFTKIRYYLTPATKLTSKGQVKVRLGDRELEIKSISSLNKESINGLIEVGETLDIGKVYTVEIEGFGEMPVVPTKVFDSPEFIENYTYDGDDLGSYIHGDTTTFKVWAPTASRVVLNLYQSGHEGEAYKNVDMVLGERGVWSHTEACGHGTYYTYTVTTSVGTQVATDPYGKAAGLNGNRTMVVDLSLTNPDGWRSSEFDSGLTSYGDAVIWEIHVRDFSNKLAASEYKGKYLAFTERGLVNEAGVPVGVDYLVQLGITHVHLLPVYDYATVDEASPEDEFNWGYDPKNYNVPEGSYSTNPYDGWVRILEYKAMVQALHDAGIGVIMDVVYNHTYDGNSSFNRIVPYYYYRYTSTGANSSASGCCNDSASERYMFRKFMVDSVTYWMTEYDLDGFRFDLMGLHDLETMQQVESAVHTIDPKAIIYGEGWTMGSTVDGSKQANQTNIKGITPTNGAIGTIAVFNDAIRDGLKGSVFGATEQGYINGRETASDLKAKVWFGINGGEGTGSPGWMVDNSMVMNYMSAHDNLTLWDKLLVSCPDATPEELQRMNRLGAAILMISQGTPFWQAGEEFLRTKDGDENSYKSSDEINNIRWEELTPDSDAYQMMLFYKGLIEMRKTYGVLREEGGRVEVTFQNLSSGSFAVLYNYEGSSEKVEAVVVINPTAHAINYTLADGTWALVCDGTAAGAEAIRTESGNISVDAGCLFVYVPVAE